MSDNMRTNTEHRMSKGSEPRTISFQPDADVRLFLRSKIRSYKPEHRRGVRTRIINECIRMKQAAEVKP